MEKEWCSNCDVQGYSISLRAKGICGRERPYLSESVRYPALLLNLALLGWDVISANIAQGWPIYLGYAVIVTVSLYLYLGYLDRYLN